MNETLLTIIIGFAMGTGSMLIGTLVGWMLVRKVRHESGELKSPDKTDSEDRVMVLDDDLDVNQLDENVELPEHIKARSKLFQESIDNLHGAPVLNKQVGE